MTTKQAVNARELHVFLEIGKDFSTWIKDRIGQYEFVETVADATRRFCGSLSINQKRRTQ